jgi:hypothetical protein
MHGSAHTACVPTPENQQHRAQEECEDPQRVAEFAFLISFFLTRQTEHLDAAGFS